LANLRPKKTIENSFSDGYATGILGIALAKRQPINHHQPTKVDHCVHGCPSSAAGTVAEAESEYVFCIGI